MKRSGLVLLLVLAAAGCSSNTPTSTGSTPASSSAAPVSTVGVRLKEFAVLLDASTAAAGSVTFNATNIGTTQHEMVVVKTDLDPGALPQKEGKVDEDNKSLTAIGEIEEFDPQKTETKVLTLTAGNYVLFCNIPGHYGQGMHARLTVV